MFAGNTQDATTVEGKIAELQTQYGLKEIIFVGTEGSSRGPMTRHWPECRGCIAFLR